MSNATATQMVDARNTRGKTPLSRPTLNNAPLDITVTDMQLSMSEGQHDAGVLSCISTTLEKTDGLVDGAISFYFGVAPRTSLFSGYITTVTDEQESQGSLSFTLSLLGATKVMGASTPRFWANTTMPSAMRSLVEANLLGVGGHTQTNTWMSLAQSDLSDWEQLNLYAKRIGWTVFHRSGVVLLYDPVKYFSECGSYTRFVSGQDKLDDDDRNLIDFQATQESAVLQTNLGAKFSYFTTGNDVQISTQTGEYSGYRFLSSMTIRDQVEAQSYLDAADSSILAWKQHAVARIWGDADIYPGLCVDVLTAKPKYRFVKTDGRWLVRSVKHTADRQQFQTQLLLSRPENQYYTPLGGYRPFWESASRPRPTMSLESNKWVSSWANRAVQATTA